jgi:hypothetical protein
VGAGLFYASGAVYAGAMLYEIVTAGDAAREHNAQLMVTPVPGGAALSLGGRF